LRIASAGLTLLMTAIKVLQQRFDSAYVCEKTCSFGIADSTL
jgi:hypothetical protein